MLRLLLIAMQSLQECLPPRTGDGISKQEETRMLFACVRGYYSVSARHSRQFCSFGREPACKKKASARCRWWQGQAGVTRYPWGTLLVSAQGERLSEGTRSCFILQGAAVEAQGDQRGRATQINASSAHWSLHKFRYTPFAPAVSSLQTRYSWEMGIVLRSLRPITDLMFMDKPKSTCAGAHYIQAAWHISCKHLQTKANLWLQGRNLWDWSLQ